MSNPTAPLTLQILADPTMADDETLLAAGASLNRELTDAALAERIEPVTAGPAAPGTKSGELITAGALLLAVLPATVPALVVFLKEWTLRNRPLRIKVTDGERSVEVDGFDPASMDEAALLALVDKLKTRVERVEE
ncbi:MAG: hypothetical protein LJE69_08825 [Thiohalocapsa sp.]|jgi:hypothetical protein|uniref:hypothetical protein n=1 Tax=Thiohalocapsa sp. TaxID=2497641 RepID=UPI0025F4C1E4|nr:hypothetical protein [Thiohalocapsa sp.]MCG6941341.1 hypothetical protein [Thiohalocapsa sp.]